MSEFNPVATKIDLDLLDNDEIVDGYRAGFRGENAPGSDKSRSYWHGWRNAMVDRGLADPDIAQIALCREVVGRYAGLH